MFKRLIILCIVALVSWSCKISYTFSGASISADVKTAYVGYFNNLATMVAPILSPTLTDELTAKIQRETRLQLIREDADVNFTGEIIGYNSAPISISGDEFAQQNRLTITVKVKFVNTKEPNLSFERTFSEYADYDTSVMLVNIENQLIPEIVTKLVDKIFNQAFSNW